MLAALILSASAVHCFANGIVRTTVPADVPRVALHDLSHPDNEAYLTLSKPFILTHATLGWQSMLYWEPAHLLERFPAGIVDHYPANLLRIENKPALRPIMEAAPEVAQAQRAGESQYLQWRLTQPQRLAFLEDVAPLPSFLSSSWIERCLPPGDVANNFVRATAWNMILIGNDGAGMFMHQDGLATATWQAQITGAKEWVLCDPAYSNHMPTAGGFDAFHVDPKKHPDLKNARCTHFTAHAGEILVYPPHWWHQTRNVGYPSIGFASRLVTPRGLDGVYNELSGKCRANEDDISLKWPGAAPPLSQETCSFLDACRAEWPTP